jgi:SHAQKYF class myb-like DNA-binding protein
MLQKQTKESSLDVSYGSFIGANCTELKDNIEVVKTPKKTKQNRHKESKDERYGRWTEDEHERLMKALDLYGNAWSLVEKYLGTRTRSQIRSHVQKYFLRVRKSLITEMAEKGELKKKVFVITKEYRNNTRAMMEAYNKAKKNTPHTSKGLKKKLKVAETITIIKNEAEVSLSPNEFLSPMNPSLELIWKQARENEDKILGHIYDLGFNLCHEQLEGDHIEIISLEKPEEGDKFNLEAENIECKGEDSVLLI